MNKKFTRYFSFSILFFFLLFFRPCLGQTAFIDNIEIRGTSLDNANQLLSIIQEQNAQTAENLITLRTQYQDQLQAIAKRGIQEQDLTQGALSLANAQAKRDSAHLEITENQRGITAINSTIQILNDNLRDVSLISASHVDTRALLDEYHEKINFQKTLLTIESKRTAALKTSLDLAQQEVDLAQTWVQDLNQLYRKKQFLEKKRSINQQVVQLQAQRKAWLDKLTLLNTQAPPDGNPALSGSELEYQMAILEASEHANLLQMQLVLLQLQNRIDELVATEAPNQSIAAYSAASKRSIILDSDFQNIQKIVQGKVQLLTQWQAILSKSYESSTLSAGTYQENSQKLTSLGVGYQSILQENSILSVQLNVFKLRLKADLTHELARRQGLPGFNRAAWQVIGTQITTLPIIAYQGFMSLLTQTFYAFKELSLPRMILCALVIFGWFVLWQSGVFYLGLLLNQFKQPSRKLSSNVFSIFLILLRRNILSLSVAGLIISLFVAIEIPKTSFAPLVLLMGVWFIFKFIINFSHIFLLDTAPLASERDKKLYHWLKWAFILGGLSTACTVLVHQLPVPFEIRDFFNRLFMLFLLLVSIVLLKAWRIAPELLESYFSRKRSYFQRIVRLLSLLIPLTLLSTALIGLLGYVDLAWAINKYEGIFLLILTGYILVRGFIIDSTEWTSEFLIQHVRSGWMWSQAILKPLHLVLRLALLVLAVVILFIAYDWQKNPIIMNALEKFFSFPLFHLAGSLITPLSIIEFFIVLCVFWWAARWSREFAYRFLFAGSKDIGVRNSLAVFTQYTMVIIGFFVILWVLGISIIALAAVLTVFSVGLAFGLRDLFKNYVSGLFLLMERPVKKGDYVSVYGHEGEVSHIGMRSFTVVTSDHMELLVPNSEIFDKPFTNWTLQDNIIRTVIPIKINRVDDPHHVQKMIADVIESSSAIVKEPHAQVLLKEIADTFIEFEVRYHINLEKTPSRGDVRSEILFKIWDCFKAEHIQPPYPQQDIFIKNFPKG